VIASLWSWLVDPANWSGENGVPNRVGEHLLYTAIVLGLAAVIAIPVGLWVGHTGRARWLVSVANSLRAVPTLGLLFAVALWLGPLITSDLAFSAPSVVVLVLLAVPPMLAGAYAGVEAVDPRVRDAARGVGMTAPQRLRRVELPNALPLLFSGVRAAMLQVVATATIAAFVGLGGLGRYLVDGIALGDYPRTAAGALLVALLAILLDAAIALVQRRSVSPGLTGGGRLAPEGRAVGAARKDSPRRAVDVSSPAPSGRAGGGN
jgi:osmoprotectant transport system permease protein